MVIRLPCPVCATGWRRWLDIFIGFQCVVCNGEHWLFCYGGGREFHRAGIAHIAHQGDT